MQTIHDKREQLTQRFSPGGGKFNRLLAEKAAVDEQLKSAIARRSALAAEEQRLLAIVNGYTPSQGLDRLVAREDHRALETRFRALDAEISQLARRQQELINHLEPMLALVQVYKNNLQGAVNPSPGSNVSMAARLRAWSKATLALRGLLGLQAERKMPEPDDARLIVLQLQKLYNEMLYPAPRPTLTTRPN